MIRDLFTTIMAAAWVYTGIMVWLAYTDAAIVGDRWRRIWVALVFGFFGPLSAIVFFVERRRA